MEVNGELHTVATLPQWEVLPVPKG